MNSSSLINDNEHIPGGCALVWQYTGGLQTYSKKTTYETVFIPTGGEQLSFIRPSPTPHIHRHTPLQGDRHPDLCDGYNIF